MNSQLHFQNYQRVTPTILKRCQNIIEELNHQLNKQIKENRQKEHLLEILNSQKNYFMMQYKQNQSLIIQLKNANLTLRNELVSLKNDKTLQNTVKQFKQQLQIKQNELQSSKQYIQQLDQKFKIEEQNKQKLDNQWQQLLDQVNNKIKILQTESRAKQEQIYHLEILLQNKKCVCEQAVKQIGAIAKGIQNKYNQNSLRSIRKNIRISQGPIKTNNEGASTEMSRQSKQTKLSKNLIQNSRCRINNSAYLNKNEQNGINKHFSCQKIKPFTISESKIKDINKKLPFNFEAFQKDLTMTRKNLKKQFDQLNESPRLDQNKVQRTLTELEQKLSNMVKKIQNTQTDSYIQ